MGVHVDWGRGANTNLPVREACKVCRGKVLGALWSFAVCRRGLAQLEVKVKVGVGVGVEVDED